MATREEVLRQDSEDLKRLGYAQQLFREMGGFSNFAVSFSVISILTGAVLLYGYGLKFAGPIVNTVGWPLVSVMTLTIAASMAELASAYPTAGGLYFWAFRLGGRGWAWTTAWLNMVGQVTITAGINVAAAIRLTARLNDFSVWWHIGGVVLIVGLMGFFATHRNPIDFLFRFENVVTPWTPRRRSCRTGESVPLSSSETGRFPRHCSRCSRRSPTRIARRRFCSCSASPCCRRSGRTRGTTRPRTWRRRR
jgi:amino acid transporter